MVADSDTADEQKVARRSRPISTPGGFTVLEEEEDEESVHGAEEQQSGIASQTSHLEPTGSQDQQEGAEEKRDSHVAEKEPAEETSGVKLSGEDGVPSVPSAVKEQSSTAPRTSDLEPSGSQTEVEPTEQKRDSSTAEKEPAEQTSDAGIGSQQASGHQVEAGEVPIADAEEKKSDEKLTASNNEDEENAN